MRVFRDALVEDEDFPLFPDKKGRELDAEMVLEFIEAVAVLMNEPLHTDKGIRRFGKHSFRATGAVFLALMGIAVEKIQLMGRWSCGVVVHYTRTAPLKSIAEDFKQDEVERKAVENAKEVKVATAKLTNTLAIITDEYQRKYDELRSLITYVEKQSRPREYVINRKTGKIHRI